jgi:hypothetical protein
MTVTMRDALPRQADLSVTSLDVGFDLRVQKIVVVVTPDTTSVKYQASRGGISERFDLTSKQIVSLLRRHGYCAKEGA